MPGVKAPEEERRAQLLDAAVAVAAANRIDGLTVRRVGERAGLSPGLVFFHFGSKDQLLLDLLERVLVEIIGRRPPEGADETGSARDALFTYARQELERLPDERDFVELFFDFWVVGTRDSRVRRRMREAMEAYRASFLPLATDIVEEEPDRFAGVPPENITRLIVSFVQGTAFQAVLEPAAFDVDALMAALEALVPPPTR